MLDLNLLRTFCKVAELGSFTKAAKQLKQPKSRVSRAISRLENQMNIQLLRRTTRQITLTDTGRELFQNTHYLLESLQSEIVQVAINSDSISGPLKLSAPEDFGQCVLNQLIPKFLELYPDIQFDLIFTNSYLNLMAHEVDIAFRIGPLEESNMIKKKLGQIRVILLAAPSYIKTFGSPERYTDLHKFNLLSFHNEKKALSIIERDFPELELAADIKCNHFSTLYQMAIHGQGIATIPDFFARQALREGQLIHVLQEWSTPPHDIHLLYSPMKKMPLKIRKFIDFIALNSKDYFK